MTKTTKFTRTAAAYRSQLSPNTRKQRILKIVDGIVYYSKIRA